MDMQTGCLPLLLALILGVGAFFVLAPSSVSVEATAAPMIEVASAPPTPGLSPTP